MIAKIKGTRDWLDLSLFNFVIDQVRAHCALYAFDEVKTPILEPVDLFKRSLGLETDIVSKEMYLVHTGHDEETICLRPEFTASVMRAYCEAGIQEKPWNVFSIGALFRHERPQKGRYREFHQINLERIGSETVESDVELILFLERLFAEKLQIDSYALLINFLGCAADREKFKGALRVFLDQNDERMCSTCKVRKERNIMRVFDCKNPACQELYKSAPKIADHLCPTCAAEWLLMRTMLEELSISYTHAPNLVRGLDYYDKTVFEFVSNALGSQSAFCGGGRYNGLSQALGYNRSLPSVGAGIGIERLLMIIEAQQQKLQIPFKKKLIAVLPLGNEQRRAALLLADELRARNVCAVPVLTNESTKAMFRAANRLGAAFTLIIGSDEIRDGMVTVKNMTTGAEERVPQMKAIELMVQG